MRPFLNRSVACFLFLSVLITGPVHAQDKIKVGVSSFSASYISMFIANKRRYYAEEGTAVDIILIAGLLGTRALIGGQRRVWLRQQPHSRRARGKWKMLMVFNTGFYCRRDCQR